MVRGPACNRLERPELLLQARTLAQPAPHPPPISAPRALQPPAAPPHAPHARCGNVASILELDEQLARNFKIFEAAPVEYRGIPNQAAPPEYFL